MKTHCPQGHSYIEVGRTSNNRCKECSREDRRRRRKEGGEAYREKERERKASERAFLKQILLKDSKEPV